MNELKVVTHDGNFHADEVMAIAIIKAAYPDNNVKVIRTRDPKVIETAELVVDVGGVYDTKNGRFDHHQKGGVQINGKNMASAGLVWNEFGHMVVKNWINKTIEDWSEYSVEAVDALRTIKAMDITRIVDKIYKSLISDIDAVDTGDRIPNKGEFSVSHLVNRFATPVLPKGIDFDYDQWQNQNFDDAVQACLSLLGRELRHACYTYLTDKEVRSYANEVRNGIVIMDRFVPWQNVINENDSARILRLVFPDNNGSWRLMKTPWSSDLPKEWWGLQDKELAEITELEDSIFCHNNGFIAGFKTREAAIIAADMSLTFNN